MEFLIYTTVGICVLLIVLLIKSPVKAVEHVILIAWLAITIAELFITLRLYQGLLGPYFYFKAILPTLHVTILFGYLQVVILKKSSISWFWHLLPFVSLMIMGSLMDHQALMTSYPMGPAILTFVGCYLLLSLRLTTGNSSGRVVFLRNVLLLYVIVWAALMAANVYWVDYRKELLGVSMLTFVVLIWVFVINSLQLIVFQEIKSKLKYVKSGMNATRAKYLKSQLESLFEEEKPYLDSNLKISDLGTRLDAKANHISQVVNVEFGMSFNDLINQYRVDAFKKSFLERSKEHLTLFAIAEECGFKSKSTFNAAFKRATGMTPTAYKASLTSDPTRSVA